ncbi:GAF domain-containing protein [Deinococcus sp. SM5_A1]|uniref:GAF domain-containing protein n=1 Tax=Deinococcus sp. SM5_A1 TaxID=3379094 RepID=UPI00385821E3
MSAESQSTSLQDAEGSERTDSAFHSQAHVQAWWRITQALGDATAPAEVIHAVVHEGIQALGARGGAVALPSADGQALEIRTTFGYDPVAVAPWRTIPLGRPTPVTEAYRQKTPLFIETRHQALHNYPALQTEMQNFTGSLAALPLMVKDQVFGVLMLTFSQQRGFDDVDRLFLSSLAGQCAQALQRSTALERTERLNEQLAFLAQASEVLSSSLDLDSILESIARLLVPRLTDWCVIHLPSLDRQQLLPVTVVHQDPVMVSFLRRFIEHNPVEISAENGVGRVFTTGLPEVVPVITDEMYDAIPRSEAWKADVRRLQLRSVITVPMHANGQVVGVLGLARTRLDQAYGQEDVTFALEVAGRAGQAVEHARLYRQAQQEIEQRQQAQKELDAVNTLLEERVRDRTQDLTEVNRELEAFTYSASHDLRTPVRHVVSFADLARRALEQSQPEKVLRCLDVIQQGALRMNTLIDGMLTLSRVGSQTFSAQVVDLEALVRQGQQDIGLEFPGRPVHWDLGPLPPVWGDPSMLQQVVTNLLSNAVKYSATRETSEVKVWVEAREHEWLVSVQDNGIGFDARYTEKLFGVFQRLHPQREVEGVGVGLATVRRILMKHRGQVFAESSGGVGATFRFMLPKPEQ